MVNKKMTLEEKLGEAIVEDVPYEVPDNWVWSSFGSVIKLISGRDVSGKLCNEEKKGIPYILGASNIKDGKFIAERWIENPVVVAEENDILISCKGTIGKTIIAKDKINISRQIMAIRCDNNIELKYIKFFIDSYVNTLIDQSKGLIPGITREDILNIKVPIPPLKEQQRIVDKIESLFEKLDKAKELIEEARDDFEKRKSAILEKAFRGELTKEWRNKRGYDKNVTKLPLREVADFKGGFAFKSNQFVDEGIQVIRMGNLYNGILDLIRNPVYVPSNFDSNIINKYRIKCGDILLTLTGTKYKRDYGYAVLIEEEKELLLNQRILNISPKENIVTSYLYYYLKSELFRDIFFSQETGGVNQGNVSGKFVESIEMNIVPVEEQKEIVRILDKLLEEEAKIEELTQLEEQIELIKKSILAKAFRGQLGTNCPEEESALELLKEILSKE